MMRFCTVTIAKTHFLIVMERYSEIIDKDPREIVLLRGRGCAYKKCAFCDYHLDSSTDEDENYALNAEALARVTGRFFELEVINSGSVFELDGRTLALIRTVCADKGIRTLHFEAHYMYRNRLDEIRRYFAGIRVLFKLGVETFDYRLREEVLHKGIPERDPHALSVGFDEANLLFGLSGQTAASMTSDIETGLSCFKRVCVNIMCENTTSVKPDRDAIDVFMREVYPVYKDNARVDILINNTDFGVGA